MASAPDPARAWSDRPGVLSFAANDERMMGGRSGGRNPLLPDQPKRIDPPSRPVDGDINSQARIRNVPPDRVVCLANPNDYDTGVSAMVDQGWRIERHSKDGIQIAGGEISKEGDVLTWNGQVIMTRTKAAHEEYERAKHGMADLRAKAIGQQGGVDRVTGANGRPAQFTDDPREQFVRG